MTFSDTLRSQSIRPLIYLSFALIFSYSLYYDVRYQPRLGHNWYIYKAVMLTNLNFILVTIYSILQFTNTILNSRKIQEHLDFAFYTSVFPIGFCTVFIFWALFFFDPDFVMPEWIRNLIPEWLNQVTHTLPLVYGIVDAFLTRHKCPSWPVLFSCSVIMTSIYWGIVFGVRQFEGYWLYPIFDLLSFESWSLVIFSVVFLYLFDCAVGVFFNFAFWGWQPAESKKKTKRR